MRTPGYMLGFGGVQCKIIMKRQDIASGMSDFFGGTTVERSTRALLNKPEKVMCRAVPLKSNVVTSTSLLFSDLYKLS